MEEVSTQEDSVFDIDEQVLEDDTSGAGLENTPEASTVGIDDQVYEDDASGADDATQEDFSE